LGPRQSEGSFAMYRERHFPHRLKRISREKGKPRVLITWKRIPPGKSGGPVWRGPAARSLLRYLGNKGVPLISQSRGRAPAARGPLLTMAEGINVMRFLREGYIGSSVVGKVDREPLPKTWTQSIERISSKQTAAKNACQGKKKNEGSHGRGDGVLARKKKGFLARGPYFLGRVRSFME